MKIDIQKKVDAVLSSYADDVEEAILRAEAKEATRAVQRLKELSPRGRRKKYWKGWRWKWTEKSATKSAGAIVYNVEGWLTNFLERSHPMPQGGRSQAYPHISIVDKEVSDRIGKTLEEELQKNG